MCRITHITQAFYTHLWSHVNSVADSGLVAEAGREHLGVFERLLCQGEGGCSAP